MIISIEWMLPLGLILVGLLSGIIFDRLVLARTHQAALRTQWEGGQISAAAMQGISWLWFAIAGIYAALQVTPVALAWSEPMQNTLLVVLILSITLVLSRIAAGLVGLSVKRSEGILPSASIFTNLARLLVFIVGVLVALQSLGISVTPILTALGVGGLAVALALQDTLSNLFAGLHILASRQIKPGNYVKLETGEEGYIADITWRNTTIRMLQNNLIVVPNSKLASTNVTNYDLPQKEMAVLIQVGVSYASDLARVEQVTIDVGKQVMREIDGGVPAFEPLIRYHTFADFSINFTVVLRAQEFVNQYLLKHEFIKRLHQRYRAEGIEIPFPIRTLYMKEQGGEN